MSAVSDAARSAGAFANGRVLSLQRQFLRGGSASSGARATLARLRKLGTPGGGSWILVGGELFDGLPDEGLSSRDQERMVGAVSCALKLYACHQQGKERPMALEPPAEKGGRRPERRSFGWSCRHIEFDLEKSQGVRRRMQSLEAASDFIGIEYHLRGLIDLMRAGDVQVDYGLLAHDLYLIQFDTLRDRVLMGWARDYYISRETGDDAADAREANE